jgi:CspA family cold shock protein
MQTNEYKTGTVKWYDGTNKGFGFIVPDEGGKDVFLHSKALLRSNIQSVKEGDRLRYKTEQSDKGFKATDIEVVR